MKRSELIAFDELSEEEQKVALILIEDKEIYPYHRQVSESGVTFEIYEEFFKDWTNAKVDQDSQNQNALFEEGLLYEDGEIALNLLDGTFVPIRNINKYIHNHIILNKSQSEALLESIDSLREDRKRKGHGGTQRNERLYGEAKTMCLEYAKDLIIENEENGIKYKIIGLANEVYNLIEDIGFDNEESKLPLPETLKEWIKEFNDNGLLKLPSFATSPGPMKKQG